MLYIYIPLKPWKIKQTTTQNNLEIKIVQTLISSIPNCMQFHHFSQAQLLQGIYTYTYMHMCVCVCFIFQLWVWYFLLQGVQTWTTLVRAQNLIWNWTYPRQLQGIIDKWYRQKGRYLRQRYRPEAHVCPGRRAPTGHCCTARRASPWCWWDALAASCMSCCLMRTPSALNVRALFCLIFCITKPPDLTTEIFKLGLNYIYLLYVAAN